MKLMRGESRRWPTDPSRSLAQGVLVAQTWVASGPRWAMPSVSLGAHVPSSLAPSLAQRNHLVNMCYQKERGGGGVREGGKEKGKIEEHREGEKMREKERWRQRWVGRGREKKGRLDKQPGRAGERARKTMMKEEERGGGD